MLQLYSYRRSQILHILLAYKLTKCVLLHNFYYILERYEWVMHNFIKLKLIKLLLLHKAFILFPSGNDLTLMDIYIYIWQMYILLLKFIFMVYIYILVFLHICFVLDVAKPETRIVNVDMYVFTVTKADYNLLC